MFKHSPQQRRDVLDRIRRQTTEVGPFVNGLSDSDYIVVASFFSPYVCRRFRRALSAAGVSSAARKDSGRWSVEVRCADRELARQLVAQQRSEYPDHRPRGKRGAFDFTILGVVAGSLAGIVSFGLSTTLLLQIATWAGFIGTGIAIGYVADRFQRSYRYLGHLQFDMVDCFVLVTTAALALSFWTFISRLL